MYLDLGRWICIVLEWTPEEASLLQDRHSLAVCCSVRLHLKGTWETQNHQKFCMRLVLVSFTINLQLHVHYNWNTPQSSEEPQRLQTTSSGYPRTKGPEAWCLSVWNLCLCHYKSTQLATCAVLFARGTCASWSSSYYNVYSVIRIQLCTWTTNLQSTVASVAGILQNPVQLIMTNSDWLEESCCQDSAKPGLYRGL